MADIPRNSWQQKHPEMFDETLEAIGGRTRTVATFISKATFDDLPAAVIHDTKRLILDTIACAMAGRDVASSRISRSVAFRMGGAAEASIMGASEKTSPPLAALANAKAANALDLDDCFMNIAHFAPQAVMAPWALAEAMKRPGRELLAAVAVGYEIAARIALAANFWRITSGMVIGGGSQRLVFGANVFASAAAAGKMLALDAEAQANALGACGHFAPCLIRSNEPALEPPTYGDSGYMAKYCDAGWSTMTGIMAAFFAQEGYVMNHQALEGRHGYLRTLGGPLANETILTDNLATDQARWYISDSALKGYPCCKYVHNPLLLFREILQEHAIRVEEIDRVVVHLRPNHAVGFANQEVRLLHGIPCTHNIPYNLALAALGVEPTARWHAEEHGRQPRVQALMRRIFTQPSGEAALVGVDDVKQNGFPKRIFSQVDVHCRDSVFTKRGDRAKGDPWWPETRFTDDDLRDKLARCCGSAFEHRVARIAEGVMDLENVNDVSTLAQSLQG